MLPDATTWCVAFTYFYPTDSERKIVTLLLPYLPVFTDCEMQILGLFCGELSHASVSS